jgi:hypothetical protein
MAYLMWPFRGQILDQATFSAIGMWFESPISALINIGKPNLLLGAATPMSTIGHLSDSSNPSIPGIANK